MEVFFNYLDDTSSLSGTLWFLVVRYCSYVSINEKNVILGGFQLASDASFVNNYTS